MDSKDQPEEFKDWRRNFLLMNLDAAFFMTAVSLADASIMSVFIMKATGSVFLVGLLQMLRTAGFFIPQILSVNISGRKNKITILKWTAIGRSCLIFALLATFLTSDLQIVTVFFFISLTLFGICDGFTVVPWLELIAKSLPPTKRSSFFGVNGFVGGLIQVLTGLFVSRILDNSDLVFPRNYGMLILIALIILMCGLPAMFFVREKHDEGEKEEKSLMTILSKIPSVMREDKTVATLVFTQLLVSFYSMATPFYSVYALSELDVRESLVGFFLSSQMLGRLAFSLIWARLCDRGSHRQIIQLTSIMYLASLFLMLTFGVFPIPRELVEYGVIAAFALTGAAMNGMWIGLNNYVMETAKSDRRPLLLGFLNSLNVMTSILPLLGGLMLGYLAYEVVFLASVIPLSISLILVRNLKTKKPGDV